MLNLNISITKRFYLAALVGAFLLGFSTLVVVAQGQDEAELNTATAVQDPGQQDAVVEDSSVFIKPQETEKELALRALYRDQVEAYRLAERAFTVSKVQFEQVQTLSSLEEAVKATQSVFFERSRVSITYIELVVEVLQKTQGVELALKERSIAGLNKTLEELFEHQKKIESATSRGDMAVLSAEFEPIAKNMQVEAHKALSLIRIGAMQSLLDRSAFAKQQIILKHQSKEVAESVVGKRERAYAEIDRKLAGVQEIIIAVNKTIEKGEEARLSPFSASSYETVLRDLGPAYAQLTQSLNNIYELLKL